MTSWFPQPPPTLSSSPQPGATGSFLAFPPNRPVPVSMCLASAFPSRNAEASSKALRPPAHASRCGSHHWERMCVPHAPVVSTSSADLKCSSLCPATPVPAPAPPGVGAQSLRQHSPSILYLRDGLRSTHCSVSPEPSHRPALAANPQNINRVPQAPHIAPPDCLLLSEL